jgi:RNA polymerase sigma factor (sigma-70 family)
MIELPQTRHSLIARLRDPRDEDAWRTFVDVYGPAVYAFARKRGLQSADASDLLQDVCRAVAGALNRGQFDGTRGKFRAWVFTVVRNQIASKARKKNPARGSGHSDMLERLNDLPEPVQAEDWDLECRRRQFRWACEKIRPTVGETTWTAFRRLAIDGASGEEVAAETGLTPAAVYLAKSRVLAKLRDLVSELEDDDER